MAPFELSRRDFLMTVGAAAGFIAFGDVRGGLRSSRT